MINRPALISTFPSTKNFLYFSLTPKTNEMSTTENQQAPDNQESQIRQEKGDKPKLTEEQKFKRLELWVSLGKFAIGTIGLTAMTTLINYLIAQREIDSELLKEETKWLRDDLTGMKDLSNLLVLDKHISTLEFRKNAISFEKVQSSYDESINYLIQKSALLENNSDKADRLANTALEGNEEKIASIEEKEKDLIALESRKENGELNADEEKNIKDLEDDIDEIIQQNTDLENAQNKIETLDKKNDEIKESLVLGSQEKEDIRKEVETKNTLIHREDVWLKEGYFRPYSNLTLWLSKLDESNKKASFQLKKDINFEYSFLRSRDCSVGEKITFTIEEEGIELIILCTDIRRAGKNPFNKAIIYDIWVNEL